MFCSPGQSVERPLPRHYLADGRSLHHTYWNQWGGTPPLRSWTSTSPSSNTSHTRRLSCKVRECMKGKQGTFKQTFAKQLKTSHHLTQYKIFNAYPHSSSSRPLWWSDHHSRRAPITRSGYHSSTSCCQSDICHLSLVEWCCRCGKVGHINKNCTSATRKRPQRQTVQYIFNGTIYFQQW